MNKEDRETMLKVQRHLYRCPTYIMSTDWYQKLRKLMEPLEVDTK